MDQIFWKCDKCGKEFKTKQEAIKHEKTCGKKEKIIKREITSETPTTSFVLGLIGGIFGFFGGLIALFVGEIGNILGEILGLGSFGLIAGLGTIAIISSIFGIAGSVRVMKGDKKVNGL